MTQCASGGESSRPDDTAEARRGRPGRSVLHHDARASWCPLTLGRGALGAARRKKRGRELPAPWPRRGTTAGLASNLLDSSAGARTRVPVDQAEPPIYRSVNVMKLIVQPDAGV